MIQYNNNVFFHTRQPATCPSVLGKTRSRASVTEAALEKAARPTEATNPFNFRYKESG